MKKLLLILVLTCISTLGFCQENQQSQQISKIDQKKFVYCELLGREKLLSTKITVDIDFGQSVSFWNQDRRYKDENGKPVVFNSMVDAMNFMGSLGWEFVQAYVVTVGQQNVYHWLLKMEKKD